MCVGKLHFYNLYCRSAEILKKDYFRYPINCDQICKLLIETKQNKLDIFKKQKKVSL